MRPDPLASFHPLISEWFGKRYGEPTAVQAETWERLARGEHVLALAPTGSGKTLAAFLDAISRFVRGDFPAEGLSVIYISPLKALNEDLRRNLETPLSELSALAASRGMPFPAIRVETRSGDTPESERRRFLSRPPAILCTTPESLAILLDSPRARPVLEGVRLLVLDEIHAIAGSKRGSLLASSVGRLALLAGEFQRVALSATVRPPERVAAFVGGLRLLGPPGAAPEAADAAPGKAAPGSVPAARFEARRVSIVAPASEKRIEFRVEWPEPAALGQGGLGPAFEAADRSDPDSTRYAAVVPAVLARLKVNRSTLLFCDARRRAERLAFLLNEAGGEGTAYAHHGSLAKEIRRMVEARLKAGELRCVAATASLELGIDIGSVDEVLLAGTPPGVAQTLQRAGRSGHGVGQVSRARLYPFHGLDLLVAAAAVEGAREGAVEEIKPPANPLDVLSQVLLSLAAEGPRTVDALYDIVRTFPPFETLPREGFDSVAELLAGRYAESRLRELKPRAFLDRASGTLRARDGARRLLTTSGGAIPDRGLYALRVKGSNARIGELDEEFVWERKAGDSFTFGSRSWRIADISAEAVVVEPLGREADFMPFWKGSPLYRSPELGARLLALMERLSPLARPEIERCLAEEYDFSPEAAREASRFVLAQREAQGSSPLPSASRIVLERWADPTRHGGFTSVLVHTLRGGAVNEPLALVLAAAWEEAEGMPAEAYADDEGVLLLLPDGKPPEEVLPGLERLITGLGSRARVERLLRDRLEASGVFAALFRENAGRALLLPRGASGKRTPLWLNRLKSKKLYEAVRSYPDFPVIVETWRSCLNEYFDLEALMETLARAAEGSLRVDSFTSRVPSPFARGALWRETGEFMYRPEQFGGGSSVSDRIIAEAISSSRLRPRLESSLIDDFVRRQKRLLPGWAPERAEDLAEWIKERVLVPEEEFAALLEAGGAELRAALAADPSVGGRLLSVRLPGAELSVRVHAERLAALSAAPADFLEEWLRREGPVAPRIIRRLFGLAEEELEALLSGLVEEGVLVYDAFRRGSDELEVLDAENLELLLRLGRKAARPKVEARPPEELFVLISRIQGLGSAPQGESGATAGQGGGGARHGGGAAGQAGGTEALASVLDRLSGYPAPAALWESDLLPARLPGYHPQSLDTLLSGGERLWFGSGREEISLCSAWELELFLDEAGADSRLASAMLSAREGGRDGGLWDFWSLKEATGLGVKEAVLAIWEEVWRGLLSSEDFRALREGLSNRFGKDLPDLPSPESAAGEALGPGSRPGSGFGRSRRVPLALRERWKAGTPLHGSFFPLRLEEGERDALDEEELSKERARLLLGRYGILLKPLCDRELGPLAWSRIFPALRRMELSGEILYGRFFDGMSGPQFMSQEAFALFQRLDEPAANPAQGSWISALDPASPAAFPFDARDPFLPSRSAANRLFIYAGKAVAALGRSGKELALRPGADGEALASVYRGLAGLRARLGRRLELEAIDGEPSTEYGEVEALTALGFEKGRGKLVLW